MRAFPPLALSASLSVSCMQGQVGGKDTQPTTGSTTEPGTTTTGTPTTSVPTTTGTSTTGTGTSSGADSSTVTSTGNTTMTEPVCGNGVVENGEDCETNMDTAECDADCTAVACGDGYANPAAGEACDDGVDGIAMDSADCDIDCSMAECGDAYTNPVADEMCDDNKNGNPLDGCTDSCKVARVVFVARTGVTGGKLVGLAGADDICAARAAGAMVPNAAMRKFRAWLSDGNVGPADRFKDAQAPTFSGNFVNLDSKESIVVDGGWIDLITADPDLLDAPITHIVNEANVVSIANVNQTVVTHTQPPGTSVIIPMAAPCDGWTDEGSENNEVGLGRARGPITSDWTLQSTATIATLCDNAMAVYCFEDAP